jgi:hypothetical protein
MDMNQLNVKQESIKLLHQVELIRKSAFLKTLSKRVIIAKLFFTTPQMDIFAAAVSIKLIITLLKFTQHLIL